ncbi:MAG: macro domain-containing protein [Myxococcota bacterium]
MNDLRIVLRAIDYGLVAAWEQSFRGVAQVEASQGSILTRRADAIVSPANSFGYMDGGLDLIYSQHFGWEVEGRVRRRLLAEYDGELPVGQAFIVPTENADIPLLISAPTMRVPMNVAGTTNAYLAFRAVLISIRDHNRAARGPPIHTVLCPGLGTGEGRMPHDRCARQMRAAYDAIVGGRVETKGGLARAVEGHMALMT